ncbi:DUF4355 domain-containing protein [Peptostreptococcaceae bacterium OttesenSCG-928-C18]|nr:DUF4355 domain-containing protein [Peptostreptococcaceae bacterium OttesenSCG-928-C18]
MNNLLPMDLQLHSESTGGTAEPNVTDARVESNEASGRTFTQDDVNGIVRGRVERATKDLEKQIYDLKERLGSQEGSKQEEENIIHESDSELEALKLENLKFKLTDIATKELEKRGYTVDEKILGVVLKDNEQDTREAVKSVTSLVEFLVNKKIKESARESTPKAGTGTLGGAKKFSIGDFASKKRIAK